MDQGRWKQIDDLVAAALEIPESERGRFVSEKCVGDKDLEKQVRELLQAEKDSDNFMANSAINMVAKAIADDSTTVFDNSLYKKTLGNYKIKNLLGAGGMGEVYLAQDEKLNRQAALKILPKEFHADSERVKRFETEARAIAALNHPNIVTIYDFGYLEGEYYIATEYVEGKTVRELINENLPLKKKLSIILQSLDALSVAHQAGIIHRDIKPENIMVRHDGYVKILDFGLVKLTEVDNYESGMFAKTMKNAVIGTPAYMSPEQASGEIVDQRTDLWSLGLVFYELLVKKNPFKRDNQKATIHAILSSNPPLLSSIDHTIPPEIERILDKALEKDADLSYQTATDFRADVKRVKREMDSSPSWGSVSGSKEISRSRRSKLVPVFAGLILLVLGAVAGIWYFFFQNQSQKATEWEKAKVVQLTEQLGNENFPSISADGKTFVYASDENGNFDIFSRRVGSNRRVNLTPDSTADDSEPAFSPDGNLIAFRSDRESPGIYLMEVTGENPRRLADFGHHPSWSPDGKQLVVSDKGYERPTARSASSLWIIDVESGGKRELIKSYASFPNWSPNGQRIAYWFVQSGGRRDIATISVNGGEPVLVTDSASTDWNPVWSPDGKYLYFASDRKGNMAFWRIRIDELTGETSGEAEIVPTPAKFNSHLSFSKDGKNLIFVETERESNIKAIEFDASTGKTVGEAFWVTRGDYEFNRPQLSPDGKEFVSYLAKSTQDDIVLINREGKNRRDLTDDLFFDRYPRWSPDGKQIAFVSDRSETYEIWLMNADGTNLRQVTFINQQTAPSFPTWSPDGRRLAYYFVNNPYILDLTEGTGRQEAIKLELSADLRRFISWDWSPDGEKLAGRYVQHDGKFGVGYYSFKTKEYIKLTEDLIGFPLWLPNSRQIVFTSHGKIFILDTETKNVRELFSIANEDIDSVNVSFDGKLLYFTVASSESNIWLLDNSEKP
jgi:serine/threonine protein kinase